MTSFYDNCNHYKKMLELQEKLRKSEEERIRLEERFKILVQESRNRHDACINRLRLRYIEFLEEQRTRDERNHKLLEALDRVDSDLASMTAKTDKLNALRKQYEAYLRRIYTVAGPSTNIIDGGDATNQSEDRYKRRDAVAKQISLDVENTSASQLLRLHGHKDQSMISPSASTRSARSTFDDYYQRNINTQPRIVSSQRISRKNTYPPISQNSETIEQPAARSLQDFERKQSHVQAVDPNLHPIARVSSGRLCSSSEQTLSHYNFNKPMTQRVEISRTASHFVAFPEHINGNVSPLYTSLNVSKNRFAPTTVDYARPSSSVHQPYQQNVKHKVSSHDMETQTRRVGAFPYEASSVYKTTSTPVEGDVCCAPSSSNRSPNLSKQATPRYYYDYTWRKPDRFRSRQKSVVSSVARPLVTSGIDHNTTRHRYQYFTPETNARVTLSARQSSVEQQQQDENRTATIVENELDRYIDKIRRLHRDLDAQSLEEMIEQEELDVPLSSDRLSEIRTVDRSKEENLPEVVEKVLALADDLASRSVDDLNVANVEPGKGRANKNRCVEFVEAASDGTPILERNDCETSAALAKREISGDIELREAKLDSRRNVKNSENEEEDLKTEADEQADFVVSSGDKAVEQDIKNDEKVTSKSIQGEEHDENDRNIYIAAESNLEQYLLDIVDELEPWSVDLLQKRVREVDLTREAENQSDNTRGIVTDTPDEDRAKQTEPSNEMKTAGNEESKKEDSNEDTRNEEEKVNSNVGSERESIEHHEPKERALANENESSEITSVTPDRKEEYKDKSYENIVQNIEPSRDQINEQNEFEQKRREAHEINAPSNITAQANEENVQDYEYSNENYYEDSNQAENYPQNYETEYTGSNEGYNYDRTNASYENNQGENYDQNVSYNAHDQEQNYDQNAALYDADDQRQNYDASYKIDRDQNYEQNVYEDNQSQEYQEYINQDYARGSSEQYGEYSGEQYGSENQYEHDPNVQYQENIADQQYSYAYDQQYDTINQENDPNDVNQCFAYTDYDPNQAQLLQEEGKPNEELQGEPKHDEAEGNADTAQRKNETSVSENDKEKKKDVVKSSLDTDTDSTIERNTVSNTESDFDFN